MAARFCRPFGGWLVSLAFVISFLAGWTTMESPASAQRVRSAPADI
jgi:hypothetical protein